MSDSTQVQFVPFHAINQFMLADYRQEVIHKVLANLDQLPAERVSKINNLIRKHVKLHGFRNSLQAPLPIRVKGSNAVFEKHPDFTAQILMAWGELNSPLRQQVYDLLKERNWELLPADTDRTILPGFLVRWPKAETYEVLDAAFQAKYPEAQARDYDIRLMVVWLAGRLPFDMVETEEE